VSLSELQKQWNEEFGDHTECPVCGTACEMLFVREPEENSKIAELERKLEIVTRELDRYKSYTLPSGFRE
jgi:hypothetical protein